MREELRRTGLHVCIHGETETSQNLFSPQAQNADAQLAATPVTMLIFSPHKGETFATRSHRSEGAVHDVSAAASNVKQSLDLLTLQMWF